MAVSDAVLQRLLALHPKVIDLSLDRIRLLLDALGHPERALPPVIHVAGTNGKGSVVAFMQAMLQAAGKSAHVYTSPHLVRFHERIRLGGPDGGTLIAEDELCALLEECERVNDGRPITFFEITTAAALLAFARHPADYLLLEVGLGGRLDATNVVDHPLASVIAPVDYDHQHFLGDTLTEIAGEKAGIMRAGVPCILGPQPEEAFDAIEIVAARLGTPLLVSGQDWQVFEQHGRLVYQDTAGLLDLPLPRLVGRFQLDNAGAAIATLRAIGEPAVQEKHIAEGLSAARWPGRLDRFDGGPLPALLSPGAELWIDGGHNPAAAQAVASAMGELEERVSRPLTLVWGMLSSKDAAGFLRAFRGLARKVVTLAIPGEENATPAADLAAIARAEGFEAEPAESLEQALTLAGRTLPGEQGQPPRVLICGSLYLAGRALAAQTAVA